MNAMPFMWARWLCQSAQTTGAVLLAGSATLRLLASGTGIEKSACWNRLAGMSWSVVFGTAVLQLGLTAADMSGLSFAQACSGQVLGSVLGSTSFGAVWQTRMYLLAATHVIGWCPAAMPGNGERTRSSVPVKIAGAVLAAALLGTLVWSGHAHASDKHAWLLPTDLLHVTAAGVWPGGLVPLALLLARARRDPSLVLPALRVTQRFSRLSLVAVGTLAVSGLLNSVGLVGTLSALWPGVYGRLILCKVALLGAMIGLGAVNRRLLRPVDTADPSQMLRTLWRNVAWESALAAVVLLATEALAMSVPPASERENAPMLMCVDVCSFIRL